MNKRSIQHWLLLAAILAVSSLALTLDSGDDLRLGDMALVRWGDGKQAIRGKDSDSVLTFYCGRQPNGALTECAYMGNPSDAYPYNENIVYYVNGNGKTGLGTGGAFTWSTAAEQAVYGNTLWNGQHILANGVTGGAFAVDWNRTGQLQFMLDTPATGLTPPSPAPPGANYSKVRYPYNPTVQAAFDTERLYTKAIQLGGTGQATPNLNSQLAPFSAGTGSDTQYIGTGIIQVSPSDARMKDNVRPFAADSAAWLREARTRLREWEWNEFYAQKKGQHGAGFVSQEMLDFAPEMVTGGKGGSMYGYNYQDVVPYLVDTVTELLDEVARLKGERVEPVKPKPYTLKVEKPKLVAPIPAPVVPVGRGDGNGKRR